jgi:hypothetical protein
LFLKGIEVIQRGWYKLKGLWDKDEANAALQKLDDESKARAKGIQDTKNKLEGLQTQMSNMDVIQLKVNDTTLGDITGKIKNKLGISAPGIPGMGGDDSLFGPDGKGGEKGGKGSAGGKEAGSIATGGTKTTNITVNLGNLVQTMTINANNVREGAERVRDIVLDELSRALAMAQANG